MSVLEAMSLVRKRFGLKMVGVHVSQRAKRRPSGAVIGVIVGDVAYYLVKGE